MFPAFGRGTKLLLVAELQAGSTRGGLSSSGALLFAATGRIDAWYSEGGEYGGHGRTVPVRAAEEDVSGAVVEPCCRQHLHAARQRRPHRG